MRIRSIKPEFWVSESMGRLSRDARLIFVGLWSLADDHGRFRADPRLIAGQLLPYDPDGAEVASRALASLREEGCVVLYEVDRSRYGAITGWKQHQKIDRPSASRLPQPPETALANPREASASPREPSCEEQGTGNREQGAGNREEGGASAPRPPRPVERGPLVYERPSKDPREWLAEDFFAWSQFVRQNTGWVGQPRPRANLSAWWSEVLQTPGMDADRAAGAFLEFAKDPHWRAAKPPAPFEAFVKVWRNFVPPPARGAA